MVRNRMTTMNNHPPAHTHLGNDYPSNLASGAEGDATDLGLAPSLLPDWEIASLTILLYTENPFCQPDPQNFSRTGIERPYNALKCIK